MTADGIEDGVFGDDDEEEDNPFKELADADESGTDENETTPNSDSQVDSKQSSETSSTQESTSAPSTNTQSSGKSDQSAVDPLSSPAFPFEQVEQFNAYVRKDTLSKWDDILFQVERELRDEYGLKGITDSSSREVYDAMLRLMEGREDELAEAIVAERRRMND